MRCHPCWRDVTHAGMSFWWCSWFWVISALVSDSNKTQWLTKWTLVVFILSLATGSLSGVSRYAFMSPQEQCHTTLSALAGGSCSVISKQAWPKIWPTCQPHIRTGRIYLTCFNGYNFWVCSWLSCKKFDNPELPGLEEWKIKRPETCIFQIYDSKSKESSSGTSSSQMWEI